MELTIRAFDCSISLRCESQDTLTRLSRFILPGLPRGEVVADISICIEREGDAYRVACGLHAESVRDFATMVVAVVRMVDEAVLERLRGMAAVHAGVVEMGGEAILLPGKTHAGKSTLVAELVRRGASYFSDEYALIDSGGEVHPYPRPLLLRKSDEERQVASLPIEFDAGRVPVGWVLALQFDGASQWRVEGLPQSEALLILLKNTPHVLAEQPRILEPLGRASASAKCYAGCRGEAADAAERILRLCTE